MQQEKINEDFLLLLLENNGFLETSAFPITKHFEEEKNVLNSMCKGEDDNIDEIVLYLKNSLKPKLPSEQFNYCKLLHQAYQSVLIDVDIIVKSILDKRVSIYEQQKLAEELKNDFFIEHQLEILKTKIKNEIELWFKIFDIERAYKEAKQVSNMKVYSHRISGWKNIEYTITENLKQEIKTNFGYGSVSYFFSVLTYKNIQITPLSDWIDYRYANFSEVIRYTKSFKTRVPVIDEYNRVEYFKNKIDNSYWCNAIDFTKQAANLSLLNEKKFIETYILSECELMVEGLKSFYEETDFEFIDEEGIANEGDSIKKYRVNYEGYELIDFRTEKIIGALQFIDKLVEYNSIIPTNDYIERIFSLSKKILPKVYSAQEDQKSKLKQASLNLGVFLIEHNKLVDKNTFYDNEKTRLINRFEQLYKVEYNEFKKKYNESVNQLKHYKQKVILHTKNVEHLTKYINIYNDFTKISSGNISLPPTASQNDEAFSLDWNFLYENRGFFNQFFSTFYSFTETELFEYYGKLSIGCPYTELGEGIYLDLKTEFGLIYNKNIAWTEKIQKLYYEKPYVFYAGSRDVYSYELKFDELPLRLDEEFERCKRILEDSVLEDGGIPDENCNEDDWEIFFQEFHSVGKYYDEIIFKKTFSNKEILQIIEKNYTNFFYNQVFCKRLTIKIKSDISDFNLQMFYSN